MKQLLIFAIIAFTAGPVEAQTPLQDLRADVQAMKARQTQTFGFDGAEATMQSRIGGFALGPGVVGSWAQWMAVEFSKVDDVFDQADQAIAAWEASIGRGDVDVVQARAALTMPLQRVARAETRIRDGFSTFAAQHVGRAHWTARARTLNAYSQCAEYRSALEATEKYTDAAYAALPVDLRSAALVPLPGAPAQVDLHSAARASLTGGNGTWSQHAHGYRAFDQSLETAGVSPVDPLRVALALAAFQSEAVVNSPGLSVHRALAASEALQPDLLREAEIQTLNQIGSVLPAYLSSRAANGPLTPADVRQVSDFAQRLVQVYEDLNDPLGAPSRLLRSLTGLRAAASILEQAETGPNARAMSQTVRDINMALSPITPYTAAFAAPQGIVAAQAGAMAEALHGGANTLSALSDYIATGDRRFLEAAFAHARQMEQTMHPLRILNRVIEGAADGVLSNIPGLRAVLGEVLAAALEDLALAEATELPQGFGCQ